MEFSSRLAMAELLIWSLPAAFRFDVCLLICCIIAGVVKHWLLIRSKTSLTNIT